MVENWKRVICNMLMSRKMHRIDRRVSCVKSIKKRIQMEDTKAYEELYKNNFENKGQKESL